MNELEELSKPLVEYLKKNYNPHTCIIITDERVQVLGVEMCIATQKEKVVPQEQPNGRYYGSSDNPMTKKEWEEKKKHLSSDDTKM